VDDVKGLHVEQQVLDEIAVQLSKKYGQETLLAVHHGKVHDYLGMTINYLEDGKVRFSSMIDYIDVLLDEAPEDMAGTTVTPTANDLFTMCKDAK
jgi:hypothetical protein